MKSLTSRLLLTATIVLLVFLGLTGSALEQAFRSSAQESLSDRLRIHIYGLLAVAEQTTAGLVLPVTLPEPLFNQLGSGLYALVTDESGAEVWRSHSALELVLSAEQLTRLTGSVNTGESEFGLLANNGGPDFYYASLAVLWQSDALSSTSFVFTTMQLTHPLEEEISSFRRTLWIWLGGAIGVLVVLQALIMSWGLAPLRRVAEDLKAIETGNKELLEGNYPTEINGVIRNLNLLLGSERQQRERYKTTMADLAHSLKTPLAILKGIAGSSFLQRALNGDAMIAANAAEQQDSKVTEVMSSIDEQVSRMDEIISYQLQKAVSSSHNPMRQSVAVRPVIETLIEALRKVYAEREVAYQLDVSDCSFYGDKRDLMELLGNLLDNASKYGDGQVVIQVRQEDLDNKVIVQIEDNGPGIPERMRQQVLQRGTRADSRQSGQGIGLAVVADIVASYNGIIEIHQSRLGGALINVAF